MVLDCGEVLLVLRLVDGSSDGIGLPSRASTRARSQMSAWRSLIFLRVQWAPILSPDSLAIYMTSSISFVKFAGPAAPTSTERQLALGHRVED